LSPVHNKWFSLHERENKEKWFSISKLNDGKIENPFFETENCSNGDKKKGNVFGWKDIEEKNNANLNV